jgi:transcriptional regulator with XRE-family HTH domain
MARKKSSCFGKLLQKLRIDHDEVLVDMASKLIMSPSYLSMIENRLREVPKELIPSLKIQYRLSDEQCDKLREAIHLDKQNNNGYADEIKEAIGGYSSLRLASFLELCTSDVENEDGGLCDGK